MRPNRIVFSLALMTLAILTLGDAHSAVRYRTVQYRYPRNRSPVRPPPTNQVARPKPVEPQEKPQKFKDLPLNTEFYFLADKDRKLFPRIKISNTQAKSVPTAANPTVTTNAVPAEAQVIVKKEGQNKQDKAGKESEKKRPDGNQEGAKP